MLKYLFEEEVLYDEHEPGFYGPTEPEYFIRNVALAQLKYQIQYSAVCRAGPSHCTAVRENIKWPLPYENKTIC